MDYQWYPGHMAKARREMQENMKLVDVVIELADARIPSSSRNPDISGISENKARILLLNKADLADEAVTREWVRYYEDHGQRTICINAREKKWVRPFFELVNENCAAIRERERKRGMKERPIRAMAVGIPNVGKSTFINTIAGKNAAKTGNKPGVTRGQQWIRLNKDIHLLDTPGILWPKFEDPAVGQRLALIGSIRDELLDNVQLCHILTDYLKKNYPDALFGRYRVDESLDYPKLLCAIASARGAVKPGNEPDTERACAILLDDFRSARLGKISLESPGV